MRPPFGFWQNVEPSKWRAAGHAADKRALDQAIADQRKCQRIRASLGGRTRPFQTASTFLPDPTTSRAYPLTLPTSGTNFFCGGVWVAGSWTRGLKIQQNVYNLRSLEGEEDPIPRHRKANLALTVHDARRRAGVRAQPTARQDVGLAAVITGQAAPPVATAAAAALTTSGLFGLPDSIAGRPDTFREVRRGRTNSKISAG